MLTSLRCSALRTIAEQVKQVPLLRATSLARWRPAQADAAGSHRPLLAAGAAAMASPPGCEAGGLIRLAVIGDVHGFWYEEDAEALQALHPDAAVFLGDFSEEDVALVERVASVQTPKAVILGNHDAWYSLTGIGKANWLLKPGNGDNGQEDAYSGVNAQLDVLGPDHVGYAAKHSVAASGAPFSIAGGRPFSKGGKDWARIAAFYRHMYEVDGFDTSADRITQTLLSQPEGSVVVVAAHNGPTGLGLGHHDICGADFKPRGGDHGDPDLEWALEHAEAAGRHVPLVLFGHMHEGLKGSKRLRNMVEINACTSAVYLNAAVVPRVRMLQLPVQAGHSEQQHRDVTARHFVAVEICDGSVTKASNVWLSASSSSGSGDCGQAGYEVVLEQALLETLPQREGDADGAWLRRRIWRGHEQQWETVVSPRRRRAPAAADLAA